MKRHDLLAGLVVVAFGTMVTLYARTFPPMPGQSIGPSFFPSLIGVALAALGTALVVSGVRRRPASSADALGAAPGFQRPPAQSPPERRESGASRPGRARAPHAALNFAAVVGVLLFYALAVDLLGFFITGTTFLGVLLLVFGVRRTWILPLAAGVTVALHYAFYTVLRVPLPWGLLEAIAW